MIKKKVSETLANEVLEAIREVVGPGHAPLHEPSFNGNEREYLQECLDSTYVSSVGKFVDKFEKELANFTGAQHVVSVVNGTSALQIALQLAGVKPLDEVLIPALTFIATANAVSYCNAIPHFVDSEEATLGIDTFKLRKYLSEHSSQSGGKCINNETGRIIRAIVPMHTFGHPSDMDGLLTIAKDFNLALVEDAAESLGSYYKGKHTGTFGLMGTLSFNGNKIITTGGGGAILTDDADLARRAKHLTTTAKLPHPWEFRHDEIGYNMRMPNLNAAVGCAQLESIESKLSIKRELHLRYQKAFANIRGIKLIAEPTNCHSNYWLQTLLLDKEFADQRNLILDMTNKAEIITRPAWEIIKSLTPYMNSPSAELDSTSSLAGRIINIPSSPSLIGRNE